jgi:hypothetical protein
MSMAFTVHGRCCIFTERFWVLIDCKSAVSSKVHLKRLCGMYMVLTKSGSPFTHVFYTERL